MTYLCTDCTREFASPQALASHAAAKHNFMHPVRQRLSTPTCPACLKFFHNRLRLTAHVMRGSATCRQYVLDHMDPLEASQLQTLADVDSMVGTENWAQRGFRVAASAPPCLAQGPLALGAMRLGVPHKRKL